MGTFEYLGMVSEHLNHLLTLKMAWMGGSFPILDLIFRDSGLVMKLKLCLLQGRQIFIGFKAAGIVKNPPSNGSSDQDLVSK